MAVLIVLALAILIESGRPVVFRQRRIGMGGSTFMILKFRTLRLPLDDHRYGEALELPPGSIGLHVVRAKQPTEKWPEFLARTPYSPAAQAGIQIAEKIRQFVQPGAVRLDLGRELAKRAEVFMCP